MGEVTRHPLCRPLKRARNMVMTSDNPRLKPGATDLTPASPAETIALNKSSGPEAVRECKKRIAYVASHELIDAIPYTKVGIATRRVREEGQGGMSAFLKKEKAPWAR